MKTYVVMVNWGGYEGWRVEYETDDFRTAWGLREQFRTSSGGCSVVILTPVPYDVCIRSERAFPPTASVKNMMKAE